MLKDDQTIGSMGEGQVFGELAILYNCTRTASVRADSDAAVWALDRRVFQAIMKKTGQDRRNENLAFLKRFVRCICVTFCRSCRTVAVNKQFYTKRRDSSYCLCFVIVPEN